MNAEDPKPNGTRHEGGFRQVVRDRANVPDSPLGELVRFFRDLTKDAQRRSK